jgi:hypothetical protein
VVALLDQRLFGLLGNDNKNCKKQQQKLLETTTKIVRNNNKSCKKQQQK